MMKLNTRIIPTYWIKFILFTCLIACNKARKAEYPAIVLKNNLTTQYNTAALSMYKLASRNSDCSLIKQDGKSLIKQDGKSQSSVFFTSLDLKLDTLTIVGDTNKYKFTAYLKDGNNEFKAFYPNNPMLCMQPCSITFIKNKLFSFEACEAAYGFFEGINDSLALDNAFKKVLLERKKLSNSLKNAMNPTLLTE